MSDRKIISPLLDGFTLGVPISEHHGVTCYPAIKENTNKKYIVKIISVPASQIQFDAMLLSGAYKDPAEVMEYFRGNGEDIQKEAEVLRDLSKIEGFLPYDGWQMEPIKRRRLGYEVCLVGSYKRSLDKYIRKNAFTHQEAVNLALDLCSALSICRQSGYLYVDLKPSNVFVSEKKEYRIGDLGFLRLNALRYASLPERYFSSYTAPELLDPMTPMNLTADTYALGMILYQLYNDGNLPFTGPAPLETLPSPCNADYEMAEIIMKAIHMDPEQRWTDPKDLGKAIASYMQRNGITDAPLTLFTPLEVKTEEPSDEISQNQETEISEEESGSVVPAEDADACTDITQDNEDPQPSETHIDEQLIEENTPSGEEEPAPEDSTASDLAQSPPESELSDDVDAFDEEVGDSVTAPPDPVEDSQSQENHEEEDIAEVSEEVARILSKAEDIIAHEIPEEIGFHTEEQVDPFAFVQEESDEIEDDLPAEPLMEDQSECASDKKKNTKHFENPSRKKKIKKFFSRCLTLLLLCGVGAGGYWYYQNIYLQTIDALTISGTQDQITVLVDTSVDESALTVYCEDENGKRRSESVEGGKVIFSDLEPSTQYTILVDMNGLHKLIGKTSDVFTTEATTQILSFQAIAGPEDGSVLLDFTVEGKEPDFWNIRYSAEGEDELLETVTGHSASITGLTVGKIYTFTLDGGKNFDVGGENSIEYLASRLVLAEDITIRSDNGSDITVEWDTPGDVVVDSWNVRFYDGYGYEVQNTATENTITFTDLDPESHYTVEVTASAMTQPSRMEITADPILVTDFKIDESAKTEMKITWKSSGNAPEGGWQLHYTVDGSRALVIDCEKTSAKIEPLVPGANYIFKLEAADGRTVFNNKLQYRTNDPKEFTEHNFKAENVTFDLLMTPDDPNWHFGTIGEEAFVNTFQIGDSASMVLRSTSAVYLPGTNATVLFVFRDAYGNTIPELTTEVSLIWKNIWMDGDTKIGELDIPQIPSVPGDYIMELYFNGCRAATLDMKILN